jgi:hypothetical protein
MGMGDGRWAIWILTAAMAGEGYRLLFNHHLNTNTNTNINTKLRILCTETTRHAANTLNGDDQATCFAMYRRGRLHG